MKQAYVYLKDKLNNEYRQAFDKVDVYGQVNLFSSDDIDERLNELIDTCLMAQQDNKPVIEVFGSDIDVFCKNFYADNGIAKNFEKIPALIHRIAWISMIFAILDAIGALWISDPKGSLMDKSSFAPLFIGILGGMIISPLILLISRPIYKKTGNAKLAANLNVIILVADIIIAGIIAGSGLADRLLPMGIPILYILVASASFLFIYYVVKMIYNKKKYGKFIAPKEEEVKLSDLIADTAKYSTVDIWYKQYLKKNDRLSKKGKKSLSEDEYLAILEKNTDYENTKKQNIVIFGGISLLAIVVQCVTRSTETVFDLVMFSVLIIVIEGILFHFMNKVAKDNYTVFVNMKKCMHEDELTFTEYAEKIASRV